MEIAQFSWWFLTTVTVRAAIPMDDLPLLYQHWRLLVVVLHCLQPPVHWSFDDLENDKINDDSFIYTCVVVGGTIIDYVNLVAFIYWWLPVECWQCCWSSPSLSRSYQLMKLLSIMIQLALSLALLQVVHRNSSQWRSQSRISENRD
jgi:hypothetical protein